MQIFNELKNRYFALLRGEVRELLKKGSVTKTEFEKHFMENSNDEKWPVVSNNLLDPEKFGIFCLDEPNVELAVKSEIPIRICEAERLWLLQALELDEANIFLKSKEKEALIKLIQKDDISPIPSDFFETFPKSNYADKLNPEFIEKMQIILETIHAGKKLKYSYISRDGTKFDSQITTPFKIEYSLKESIFRLCHFPDDEKRPVKSRISRMSDLRPYLHTEDTRSLSEMLESRRVDEPLVFTVFNTSHNAIERAKILFSIYPRTITDNVSDNGKLLSVEFSIPYHYTFQEKELIDEILSFGPRIKVNSPLRIAREIKEKILSQIH